MKRVVETSDWSAELQDKVRAFLLKECGEKESFIKEKLGYLHNAGINLEVYRYIYGNVFTLLHEPRPVCFLWADLHAFGSVGISVYHSIIDPIIVAFDDTDGERGLKIVPIEGTDSLRAHSEQSDRIGRILRLASELRNGFLTSRSSIGLPDAVGIGIGVAYGKCLFNVLKKDRPKALSGNECAWTEAARLHRMAERLCKYLTSKGGVILVSDTVAEMVMKGIVAGNVIKKNAGEEYPELTGEVNIYDE